MSKSILPTTRDFMKVVHGEAKPQPSDVMEVLGHQARIARTRMSGESSVLLKEIGEFLESGRVTHGDLAQQSRVSPGTLSDVLRGKYAGDTAGILRRVAAAIAAIEARAAAPGKGEHVSTRVAKEIDAVLNAVISRGGIGLITGPSGIGKTMTLLACIDGKYPQAIYLAIDDESRNPTALYQALLRRCGRRISRDGLSLSRGFAYLKKEIRVPLIIDEAENLRIDAINGLRQLHDATGCPLVFVGRPHLRQKIQKTAKDERIGGSLLGRIVITHDLTSRTRGKNGTGGKLLFSREEILAILAKNSVRLASDAHAWITALANMTTYVDGEGRGLRYAINLAITAAFAYPDKPLTLAILRGVNAGLVDEEYAHSIEDELTRYMKMVC